MATEQLFRGIFTATFAGLFIISGVFRWRARKTGGVISRASEGKVFIFIRLFTALPLFLSFILYMINPQWMNWASLPVLSGLRWLAAILAVASLPLMFWVLSSIGKNVSETFLTKQNHELVTRGPYLWVRHPLYTVATICLVSLSTVAANWFMMFMALMAIFLISVLVIPREENALIQKFGDAYRSYQKQTGRLAPRFVRHA